MKNDSLAVASMVLGIISLVLIFIPGINFIAIVCGILAIIFGNMSKNKINSSDKNVGGYGMAQAGFILGIITIALFIITLAACGALIGSFMHIFE